MVISNDCSSEEFFQLCLSIQYSLLCSKGPLNPLKLPEERERKESLVVWALGFFWGGVAHALESPVRQFQHTQLYCKIQIGTKMLNSIFKISHYLLTEEIVFLSFVYNIPNFGGREFFWGVGREPNPKMLLTLFTITAFFKWFQSISLVNTSFEIMQN